MDRLKLYIDNISTLISGDLRGDKYKCFKQILGYYPEDAMWRQQNNPHWDGLVTTVCYNRQYCKCAVKKDGMHFPTGLISKALTYFRENEIEYEISDIRNDWQTREIDLSLSPVSLRDHTPFSLYDYQRDALEKSIASQRGILKLCTGAGKTKLAAAIIAAIGVKPVIFYVTSKDLLTQAINDLQEVLLQSGSAIKVGAIGCGHKNIGDITVMTVQTAVRAVGEKFVKFDEEDKDDSTNIDDIKKDIADLIRSAKMYIADECITGDSVVLTRDGPVAMKDLSNFVGKELASFSDNSVVWKKITKFHKKGVKPVVKLTLTNDLTIRCTKDHLLMTENGWIPAGLLNQQSQILCHANAEKTSGKASSIDSRNVCDTNYVQIESIQECGNEEVFDITVEDTHCFFANGMLVHNCHHWRSETCQIISQNSLSARWRYALSATPFRDAGDDILIDACFGRTIVDINASYLIKRGFLVKPHITFVPIKNLKGENLGPYASVYKLAIAENAYRNEMIAKMAVNLRNMDRKTVVLVQQIHHGELLQKLIPDSVFIHGSSGKIRQNHIASIKNGNSKQITIASTILDEGLDCKPLDALILAGGGRSPTRALQRIGRVIRNYTYPDGRIKENSFVYDFHDHQKYVTAHSLARRRIYATETEFEIRDA